MFKKLNKKRKYSVLILIICIFAFCVTASAQVIRSDNYHSLEGFPTCYNNYGSNIGFGASNLTYSYIFNPLGKSDYTSPYQFVSAVLYEDGYSKDSTNNSAFNVNAISTIKNWNYGSQGHIWGIL